MTSEKYRAPPPDLDDWLSDPLGQYDDPPLHASPREHVLSMECWCHPTIEYVDPITGVKVVVHHRPQ